MSGPRPSFPAALRRFVELFNAEEFWESHEVLEGPWRTEESGFYHGLILFASAFVHVQRDNPHGIGAQLRKAERALEPYRPSYLGVDVDGVLEVARAVGARVEGPRQEEEEAGWSERISFPRLELEEDHLRGDEPELGAL